MKKQIIALAALLSISAFAKQDVAEGTVAKVVPAKKEIYVQVGDKKNEYYFTPTTTVETAKGPAAYEDLKEGTKVRVTADKKGKRLTPVKVEILE